MARRSSASSFLAMFNPSIAPPRRRERWCEREVQAERIRFATRVLEEVFFGRVEDVDVLCWEEGCDKNLISVTVDGSEYSICPERVYGIAVLRVLKNLTPAGVRLFTLRYRNFASLRGILNGSSKDSSSGNASV